MSVMADKWIREQALQHKMIEPFFAEQQRVNPKGERAISFGLSSYGYDARVGNEFKVFTNVNSAVVDPKDFSENAFVHKETDVCIIPPNSFVLAKTVEHFRVPRDVLVVCLGKSTYARCFSGGTRVALADGTSPTLEEMAVRAQAGERFWGYSIVDGRVAVTLLDAPRFIGRDNVVEVTLDNGQVITTTPDHEFLLRRGGTRRAGELDSGSSLMPLYRTVQRGYEAVYQPKDGRVYPTHRLADEWNIRNGVYAAGNREHRHHIDHDKLNNNPWNIARMDAAAHVQMHNAEHYGEGFDPADHGERIKSSLADLAADESWLDNYSAQQSVRAKAFWSDEKYAQERAALLEKRAASWTTERRLAQSQAASKRYESAAERAKHSLLMKAAWASDEDRRKRQAEVIRGLNLRTEIDAAAVMAALKKEGTIRGAARYLNCDRSVFRRFPEVVSAFNNPPPANHKVVSVRKLSGEQDVYCLTVPEAGNFALEAGVFVSNCGIIVNVTPLEPEWEGQVTLEFSNTTPLPAKIYANEGACQFLFLKGDQPCEVSYRDRKGKYQGQVGVVLPRL